MLGRIAMRLKLPSLVGELCAGVLLGPSVLQQIWPASDELFPRDAAQFHLLDALGQFGVLLLVGVAGAHVDLALFRARAKTALAVSSFGLLVPLVFGIAVGLTIPAYFVGPDSNRHVFALFLGVALCVSAIPVIAKTLIDMNLIHRTIGQLALTAAMLDDAVGWFLLAVVAATATSGFDLQTILMSFGALTVMLVFAIAIGRPLVRRAFRAAERTGEPLVTLGLTTSLILLSAAATHSLGLESLLGAFVCGVLINEYGRPKPSTIAPLRNVVLGVLAPIFFATAGLRMDLTALAKLEVVAVGLLILAVAIAGKFIGAFIGARISKLGNWEAFALGSSMNARGVVEIVIAMTGLALGVLTTEVFTIIVLVAIATSVLAPPLLRLAMDRIPMAADERVREERRIEVSPEPAITGSST
ncbi:cation:proton antiporter [Rhodococcus sp. NPDC058521]|uniref:cation:proton antiporter n=1 Tax=Rhodococcus sp. NPDC058521 TaxID=3346536 RepID=UPI00365F6AC7